MSEPHEPSEPGEFDLYELLELLDESDPETREALLRGAPEETREEVSRALAARSLLASVAPIQPPQSLPQQTAKRARRRIRAQRLGEQKSALDGLVTGAAVLLILGIIALIVHHAHHLTSRGDVKVLKAKAESSAPQIPVEPTAPQRQ